MLSVVEPARAASPPVSRSQAEAVVARAFHPGSVIDANLIRDVTGKREWNLLYRNGSTALVSATTGEILQFSSLPTLASAQGHVTASQAVAIAARTIRSLAPAHAFHVRLDPLNPALLHGGQYVISFTRMVHGIPFPANGFRVKVDKNGSVSFYQTTWYDHMHFPPPTHVLGRQEILTRADDIFTANPRLTLFYYLLPWEKAPRLLYLVQTAGGQLALYADSGNLVRPPGAQPHIPPPGHASAPRAGGLLAGFSVPGLAAGLAGAGGAFGIGFLAGVLRERRRRGNVSRVSGVPPAVPAKRG